MSCRENIKKTAMLNLSKYRFWSDEAVMYMLQTLRDILLMTIRNSFEYDKEKKQVN